VEQGTFGSRGRLPQRLGRPADEPGVAEDVDQAAGGVEPLHESLPEADDRRRGLMGGRTQGLRGPGDHDRVPVFVGDLGEHPLDPVAVGGDHGVPVAIDDALVGLLRGEHEEARGQVLAVDPPPV
jgi:hypothetical protein